MGGRACPYRRSGLLPLCPEGEGDDLWRLTSREDRRRNSFDLRSPCRLRRRRRLLLLRQSVSERFARIPTPQNVATLLSLADQHHCDVLKEACIEFICFSTMDDIVATQGFVDLQKNCPSVLVDAFVKMSIIKKT
ncbi:hypothetical protein EJB05_09082, partial [Eragrostis curvula]